jgi:hypothetical protein
MQERLLATVTDSTQPTDPDYGPPTFKQQNAIRNITRNIGVEFTGETKADACLFISEYLNKSRLARQQELIDKASPRMVDAIEEHHYEDPELERL